MAEPPLLEGADHDADQFRLEPLSADVAVSEVTMPGTDAEVIGPISFPAAYAEVPPEFVADAYALR
jgi:hypothetical protein